MAITVLPAEAVLRAEISRHCRRRLHGVYLAAAAGALCIIGVMYSFDMMHEPGAIPVDATIVAVERDPGSGETWMTSEFVDHKGVVHQDRLTSGYHYARGEPEVGERIEYVYEVSQYTGQIDPSPRSDRLLQWIFGIPALLFAGLAAGVAWLVLRQRNLRRRLLDAGRREPGTAHAIAEKTVILPGGRYRSHAIRMWRLEARYLEAGGAGFRECHSDWQPAPAPVLAADTPVPPIFVDRVDTKRYWLPVGELVSSSR